jgi:serine/threonine-protein kinase
MGFEIDQVIDGKYRILRLIGEGGMGSVYEGHHLRIERRVAIKVLHASLASEEAASRFEREARAACRIGNDHILDVHDVGQLPDGTRYMVSEYLDGQTLDDRIAEQGRLAAPVAVSILLQLLDGLAAAHRATVLHRDLKPSNVFLVRSKAGQADFVKIIDFGVSKFQPLGGGSMTMTATGAVLGTPFYMSPEQARGSRDIDARSDLYAAAVILYQMLTGRRPFEADSYNQLLFRIVFETPPALDRWVPEVDPALAALVSRGLAKDPAQRFQTAEDLAAALSAWASGQPAAAWSAVQAPSLPPLATTEAPPQMSAAFPAGSGAAAAMPLAVSRADPTPRAFGATHGPRIGGVRRTVFAAVLAIGVIVTLGLVGTVFLAKKLASSHPAEGNSAAATASSAPSERDHLPTLPVPAQDRPSPATAATGASQPAESATSSERFVSDQPPSGPGSPRAPTKDTASRHGPIRESPRSPSPPHPPAAAGTHDFGY